MCIPLYGHSDNCAFALSFFSFFSRQNEVSNLNLGALLLPLSRDVEEAPIGGRSLFAVANEDHYWAGHRNRLHDYGLKPTKTSLGDLQICSSSLRQKINNTLKKHLSSPKKVRAEARTT